MNKENKRFNKESQQDKRVYLERENTIKGVFKLLGSNIHFMKISYVHRPYQRRRTKKLHVS